MKRVYSMLVMLFLVVFAIAQPPCYASNKTRGETSAKEKGNAIETSMTIENAAFQTVFTHAGESQDAPAVDAGILIKTPAVEVSAKTTVATNRCYQRFCARGNQFILKNRISPYVFRVIHVDPGLRGC